MTYRVQELLLADDSSPYADWFNELDAQAAAKVSVANGRRIDGTDQRFQDDGSGACEA